MMMNGEEKISMQEAVDSAMAMDFQLYWSMSCLQNRYRTENQLDGQLIIDFGGNVIQLIRWRISTYVHNLFEWKGVIDNALCSRTHLRCVEAIMLL